MLHTPFLACSLAALAPTAQQEEQVTVPAHSRMRERYEALIEGLLAE